MVKMHHQKYKAVLSIVRELETKSPTSDDLLSNPSKAQKLDGIWYLQYTSPSVVGDYDDDKLSDSWKPIEASEGLNIPTNQIKSKGSVSASGITVDTSNRVVKQIFDIDNNMVSNEIQLNESTLLRIGGTFRVSENVPTRALVSFTDVDVTFNNNFVLKFGFLFSILAVIRGNPDNGWLENTYLDDDIRIGRGNKGSMFVLTRDYNAITP